MPLRISKVQLQGFKSFRKKIAIPFPPGFNVIAGPNGSGKSNVMDAFTFVLGTLSSRSLRADRLNELIYHGHGQRRPADFAKVSLGIDNSENILKEMPPEITISRKVNQKGISTFRINGKIETRNRVVDLLAQMHVFPDGHNIIMQGDITRIIEMNPVERRETLDEISGIAEYEDKKVKTQRELEKVDARLKEFDVIVKEREQILEKLKKERDAAVRYQKLESELRKMRASLNKIRLEDTEKIFNDIAKEIEDKQKLVKELEAGVELADKQLEELEKKSRSLASEIIDKSKDAGLVKEQEQLRGEIMRIKDKVILNEGEIKRLDHTIERIREIEGTGNRATDSVLKLGRAGVYGTVGQLMNVSEQHSTAIEICAGSHMYDLVVKDDTIAEECINFLKRERLGRSVFIPLNKIRGRDAGDGSLAQRSGAVGWAIDLIKFDEKYRPAMEHIFGSTLVVKNIDAARQIGIGRTRMVSLEGDLIEKSGVMIGGHYEKRKESTVTQYLHARDSLKKEIEQLSLKLVELESKQSVLAETGEEKSKEVVDLEDSRGEAEKEYEKIRVKRRKDYEQMLRDQEKLGRLKIEKARTEAQLDNLKIERKDFEAVESFYRRDPKELDQQIRDSLREINTLGPINMKSIQEYDIIANEFTELSKKFYKIKEEKLALDNMMADIESKRRETFMKTFELVRGYFKELFQKISGGVGDLQLEQGDNIDSGLLIRANPAGKVLINMDSLSGGEKTLVALCFIFALQKTRPSPFYLLDEVDAALDKANSRKVVDLVQELAKEAQFIMITHNDTTISSADRVIGVTMHAGESRIVGVELTQKVGAVGSASLASVPEEEDEEELDKEEEE